MLIDFKPVVEEGKPSMTISVRVADVLWLMAGATSCFMYLRSTQGFAITQADYRRIKDLMSAESQVKGFIQ